MFASRTKLALRTVIALGEFDRESFIAVTDLAKQMKAPQPYLSKIVKKLAHADLIETKRGAGGGVRLGSKVLTFLDICEVMEDPIQVDSCMLSTKTCNRKSPCPFHERWSKERQNLKKFLTRQKIKKS